VRAGNVVLANALGSAFLETPALQGFLPAIARRLRDEPLLLSGPPTWWCGEAAAWADARQRLPELLARSTYPSNEGGSVRTSRTVSPDPAAIEADPDAFTLQARLPLAFAPIWGAGAVQSRPAVVRVYAIADGAGRWHLLPGGMTRVAGREGDSISMQRGGVSLDTWVQTEGPVDTFSMLPSRLSVDDIAARRRPVASRAGENLFWLGRYTERTEQQVQLARAVLAQIDADTDAAADEFMAFLSRWAPVYVCFTPLYVVPDGSGINLKYLPPMPTTSGLMLLDASLRYETANLLEQGIAYLKACGYGAASKSRMDVFEQFLFAKTPGDESADLDPSKRTNVDVVPTTDIEVHPIPPPDVDPVLYAKWQARADQIVLLYDKLANAKNEADRGAIIDALETERQGRDAVAKEILTKAPPRDGSTTVEHPEPYITAGMAVGAGLLLGLGAIIVSRARRAPEAPVRRAKRRRR